MKAARHKKSARRTNKQKQPVKPVIWIGAAALLIVGLFAYWFFALRVPNLPEPTLKSAAAKHGIGLSVLTYPESLDSPVFKNILGTQYAGVTIDGALHWDQMRPSETTYNFAAADKIVNYAAAHNLTVQVHHLMWDEDDSLPKWIKTDGYSQQQLSELLHKHITTVMQHFKGKVQAYTVVNEPFTRAKHLYNLDAWWHDHLGGGTDYIDKAFQWARAADPKATLILNDFANDTEGEISNIQYAYMKSAKERGIPIDAIGMQVHINATHPPSYEAMVKNMRRFGALGYKVYITEFDIDSHKLTTSRAEKWQLEARITSDVVRACVDSKACTDFTVFGMKDKPFYSSWFGGRPRRSYMLTNSYQPKPAYQSFHDAWMAK